MKRFVIAPAALLALAPGLFLGGCGGDDVSSEEGNIAETEELFGDDRVADALKGNLEAIPGSYPAVEQLFGIGRACVRGDSKEIFVVEEESSREGGTNTETEQLLPRAVITGCNTNTTDPNSAINSFGLMVALFSAPDATGTGDTMVLTPVETMALDRTTGLYNFYVFGEHGEGSMSRIQLRPNDEVVEYRYEPGQEVRRVSREDRACNNCHANMGPLMNELTEPWTNWVSQHKTYPEGSTIGGETAGIVDEAISLNGAHNRSSFANDLEPIMESAIRVWLEGVPESPGSGFIQATIDGDQPNGVPGLMESVFCQTELNYASAFTVVPMELFVDPAAVAGAGLSRPGSYSIDVFPTLMPVRSEMDKRIERALMKKRILSLRTVSAIRLWDDQNDIFSDARCGLYPEVTAALPENPDAIDAHVAGILLAHLDAGEVPAGPRADYIRALITPDTAGDALKAARTAYLEDAKLAYAEATALLETEAGREQLKQRSDARKLAAQAMFPGEKSPVPVLELEAAANGGTGGGGGGGGGGGMCAHSECSEGVALDAACSECATAVCAADSFCCENTWDDQCVTIATGQPACGC